MQAGVQSQVLASDPPVRQAGRLMLVRAGDSLKPTMAACSSIAQIPPPKLLLQNQAISPRPETRREPPSAQQQRSKRSCPPSPSAWHRLHRCGRTRPQAEHFLPVLRNQSTHALSTWRTEHAAGTPMPEQPSISWITPPLGPQPSPVCPKLTVQGYRVLLSPQFAFATGSCSLPSPRWHRACFPPSHSLSPLSSYRSMGDHKVPPRAGCSLLSVRTTLP